MAVQRITSAALTRRIDAGPPLIADDLPVESFARTTPARPQAYPTSGVAAE